MKGDIDRTHHMLKDVDRKNTEVSDWIRAAESDLAHSQARERELDDIINTRNGEINRKNDQLAAGEAELNRLREAISKAEADMLDL